MSDTNNKNTFGRSKQNTKELENKQTTYFLILQNKWRQILKSVITFMESNFTIN